MHVAWSVCLFVTTVSPTKTNERIQQTYRVGCGEGVSQPPPSEIFFDFGSQNGDLWCILGAIFCSSAKTFFGGGEDTLAQVYFYWGAIARLAPPPGIDALF